MKSDRADFVTGTTPSLTAAVAQRLECKEANLALKCSGVMMLAMSPREHRSYVIRIWGLACHRRFLVLGTAVKWVCVVGWGRKVFGWVLLGCLYTEVLGYACGSLLFGTNARQP